MMSSFIALAAGMIGSVDIDPPVITEVTAPAPAIIEHVVEEAVQTVAAPVIVPVQATPEPDLEPESDTEFVAPPVPPAPIIDAQGEPERIDPPEQVADPSIVSPTERRAILQAASEALGRVETAAGNFTQVDNYGSHSTGEFALQRPGRMRFDYADPSPLLIAADGATVAISDADLEQVDRVPLASTPLGLLLDDDIDFQSEAEVIRVQRANGLVAITVVDPTENADGELTLVFDAGSYDLLRWQVMDANGGVTTVSLQNVRTGMSLNPRLFRISDFEDEDDDRR